MRERNKGNERRKKQLGVYAASIEELGGHVDKYIDHTFGETPLILSDPLPGEPNPGLGRKP